MPFGEILLGRVFNANKC